MKNDNLHYLSKFEDPAEARTRIQESLGDLPKNLVFTNRVLVATYITPEVTKGGIFMPEKTVAESRFQGKVGLVVMKGPLAFEDDANTKFGGASVEVGDWVWYRASDGMEVQIRKTLCRIIPDVLIIGRVDSPELIW